MLYKIPSSSVSAILLAATLFICSGITEAANLRCQCIKTVTVLKPIEKAQVLNVQLINRGPHCPRVEVIVTLKDGHKDCLNPEVTWVKSMISNILDKKMNVKKVKLQPKN